MDEHEFNQAVVSLIHMAANDIESGNTKLEIIEKLKSKGCHDDLAEQIRNKAQSIFRKAQQKKMLMGGGICTLGLIVTIGTIAASSGGGIAVFAYGAIFSGGWTFFKGLLKINKLED